MKRSCNSGIMRFTRFAGLLIAAMACLLSSYIILSTIYSVCFLYSAVPSGDLWWFIKDIADFKSHRIGLNFLWGQLGEHRIVLPRLILWIDMECFQFRGIFTIICSFLFQTGEALLLCIAFWRVGKNDLASKVAYAALAFGMMLSSSQIDIFVQPILVLFPLAFLMSSLSIFLIMRHYETRRGNWLAMSIGLVAAVCATLSLGSGLLVWLVLLLICVIEHGSRKTLCTTIIAGTVMWGVYFIGYCSPTESADPRASLLHPIEVAGFAFTFLTNVFNSTPSSMAGILGLCLLSLLAIGLALYIRVRTDFSKPPSFCVYIALFITSAACLTALGRLNYSLFEALSIRYRTPALIFWAAILGLGFSWWNGRAGDFGRSLGSPILAVLFLALFVLPAQRQPLDDSAYLSEQIKDDGIALAFDATDEVYGQLFSLRPDLVRDYTPFLRENRLSLFDDRLFASGGRSLTSLSANTSTEGCSGSVDGLKSFEDTAKLKGKISGWSRLQNEDHGSTTVVLVDDRGMMIGLARGVGPQAKFPPLFQNPTHSMRWLGYYHAGPASKIIAAYAVMARDSTVCPLGRMKLQP
jgi:hypothetical protein